MKIDILVKSIDVDSCLDSSFSPYYNKIKNCDFCCPGMEQLYLNNVVNVVYGTDLDELYDGTKYDENLPFLGIVMTNMVDNGDYSYDGEDEYWESNYEEEFSYFSIKKCPCCGEDIVINVEKKDITEEINNKLRMLPKGRCKKLEKEKIYNEIDNILEC